MINVSNADNEILLRSLTGQWNGQYTGNIHSTKAKDLEEILRRAAAAFRKAEASEEIAAKGTNIRKLAEKLLVARLKF